MLIAPARRLAPDFEFEIPDSFEGPLWRLMQERPANLLASNYADWDAFLRDALTASERLPAGCADLASCTWGTANALHVAHPLSSALPFLARFLDMPTLSLPGGRHDMPRIQGPDYGASERFSVAPGHERDGYFHMPGGQSGNPFSPSTARGSATGPKGGRCPCARPHRTLDALIGARRAIARESDLTPAPIADWRYRGCGRLRFSRSTQPRPSAQIWFTGHTIGLPATQPRASAPGE